MAKGFAMIPADPNATDALGKITNAIAIDVQKQVGSAGEKICAGLYPKFLELQVDATTQDEENAKDSAVTTVAIAMLQQALHMLRQRNVPPAAAVAVIVPQWPELIAEIVEIHKLSLKKVKKPRRPRR